MAAISLAETKTEEYNSGQEDKPKINASLQQIPLNNNKQQSTQNEIPTLDSTESSYNIRSDTEDDMQYHQECEQGNMRNNNCCACFCCKSSDLKVGTRNSRSDKRMCVAWVTKASQFILFLRFFLLLWQFTFHIKTLLNWLDSLFLRSLWDYQF